MGFQQDKASHEMIFWCMDRRRRCPLPTMTIGWLKRHALLKIQALGLKITKVGAAAAAAVLKSKRFFLSAKLRLCSCWWSHLQPELHSPDTQLPLMLAHRNIYQGFRIHQGDTLKKWPRKETHFVVDCVNFALLECIFFTMGAVLTFHGRYWGDCLWCSWAEGEWEEYSRHSHIALYHHHHHHQNHHHRHRHRRHHRHNHHHHHHLVHHHHHPLTRVSGRNIQGTPTLHFICFC